jgi:protein-tyrosine phosphatase
MTFLPGKQRDGWSGMHWRDLPTDAWRLHEEFGIDLFLLLVEDHELEWARVPELAEAMAAAGVELVRFPIPDMDVTTDRDGLRRVLDDVLVRLRGGQCVAVACRGGLGRTGTIVACLLRDAGLDGDEAIALTRASRHDTIERQSQVDFVHDWTWPPREALA